MPTVDGYGWVKERLRFLEQLLRDEPEHEHRQAIEDEIEKLRSSIYSPKHGWRRWLGLPRRSLP